jgi:hypothetical protein
MAVGRISGCCHDPKGRSERQSLRWGRTCEVVSSAGGLSIRGAVLVEFPLLGQAVAGMCARADDCGHD